jgi:hypothetical protein
MIDFDKLVKIKYPFTLEELRLYIKKHQLRCEEVYMDEELYKELLQEAEEKDNEHD